VIVVGGGIMGASTALFLRQRGKSVILLERDLIGQKASGVNFGNVRRQGRRIEMLPLAHRSMGIWHRLPELVGETCEFVPTGHMRLAYDAERAAGMEAYAQEAAAAGLPLEFLASNEMRSRYDWIGKEVYAACLSPEDGHANPRLLAPAFGRAAVRAGAEIMENAEVLSMDKEGDDFVVAIRDRESVRAPVLVVTAGAWGGRMAEAMGEPVPLIIAGPQMSVTEPLPYRIRPTVGVFTQEVRETVYFRQVERGNIVIGGCIRAPLSAESTIAKALPEAVLMQMEQMRRIMPAIDKVHVIRTWSGVESYLPDDRPIIGPSKTTPGLFYAFGFCGAGFQIGPGVGDVMAELIATGSTTTPIEPYRISRFCEQGGTT